MSHVNKCTECGNTFSLRKFLGQGERMIKSFHHIYYSKKKSYDIIWERLQKNPHLLLYSAGLYHRNILRCAIFRSNYAFVEELINFGRISLSPELYEEWMNDRGGYCHSGCYYRYPIYTQNIEMIELLLRLNVPFRKDSILATLPFTNMEQHPNATTEKRLFILEILLQNGACPNGYVGQDIDKIEYWHKESYFTFPNSVRFGILDHPDAGDIFTLLCKYGFDFDCGIEVLTNDDVFVDGDTSISREEFPLIWLYMIDIRRYIDEDVNVIFPIFSKNVATILSLYFSKKFNKDLLFIDFERYIRVMCHRLGCGGFDIFDYRYGEDYRTSLIYKMVRHYAKYIEVFILLFNKYKPFLKNSIWGSLWWDICEYL